jgi:hypothetical protein
VEGVPDLLDLERRIWSCQVPFPEVRLAKGQIEKRAVPLSQNPTTIARVIKDSVSHRNVVMPTEEPRRLLLCSHLLLVAEGPAGSA